MTEPEPQSQPQPQLPSSTGGNEGPKPPPKGEGQGGIDPMFVLLLMIGLAVAGWFLVQKLMEMSRIQDCVMAGRKNCAPIDDSNSD
jgi:hypothetical protein